MQKNLIKITKGVPKHWVGNGFNVQTLMLPSDGHTPFLLIDYAKAQHFPAKSERRGVGLHPHRGFETVTIVYQGGVEHKDTLGNYGKLAAGDIQWMTAGAGIQHEEWHSESFREKGGVFELVQLWIDLPQHKKFMAPMYQDITADRIPSISLGDSGSLRVLAGEYQFQASPVMVQSPMQLLDLDLHGNPLTLRLDSQFDQIHVLCVAGQCRILASDVLEAGHCAQLTHEGTEIVLQPSTRTKLLVLAGQSLRQEVWSKGPFVLANREDLAQAYDDFRNGTLTDTKHIV